MPDSLKPWRKVLRTGAYFRRLKRSRQRIENDLHVNMNSASQNDEIEVETTAPRNDSEDVSSSASELNISASFSNVTDENEAAANLENQLVDDEAEPNIENEPIDNEEASSTHHFSHAFRMSKFLQRWALQYKVPVQTLAPLFAQLNEVYCTRLPKDPRTLLGTRHKEPQQLLEMSGGSYWHQGFEKCINHSFSRMQTPMAISININIDGIPIYNNGSSQFWPILFNVQEFPAMKPMAIGIFYGHSKPKMVEEFLQPFVDEMIVILNNGVIVNGHKLTVKIRAFICDTPARSFIKGVCADLYLRKMYEF